MILCLQCRKISWKRERWRFIKTGKRSTKASHRQIKHWPTENHWWKVPLLGVATDFLPLCLQRCSVVLFYVAYTGISSTCLGLKNNPIISLFITLCTKLSGTVYCYRSCLCACLQRSGRRAACVCLCVCVCSLVCSVCYHDNLKLLASILTKLGL